MLYGGDLYKGFPDLGLTVTLGSTPNFHLSIGVAPLESQAWTLRTYAATIWVAMPTVMCRLADYLIELDQPVSSVRLLLYIGELLRKDQKFFEVGRFLLLKLDRFNMDLSVAALLDFLTFRPVALIRIPHVIRSTPQV